MFADIKLGDRFVRLPVTTAEDRDQFLTALANAAG